jgi:hypothetical protein
MKLNSFCTAKEMVNRLKRQPTEREKIFAINTYDKSLITRMNRELKKLFSQKSMTQQRYGQLNRTELPQKKKKKPSTNGPK